CARQIDYGPYYYFDYW
nr:immunoglobulin heavy chain junction region [Mus musculus]